MCSFFSLFDSLISFIIDVPRPLRNEILDHCISKGCHITSKMSQSVRNIFIDSREYIFPYYSQNIRLKIIHYTCCLTLSSVGKRLKKSMKQVLALRQSRYFLNICEYFKKICQTHRDSISHIERTVNVLDEDPTKITMTNASMDKQITLDVSIFTKLKIRNQKQGFQTFYYVYHSILKHINVLDRLAQCMRYASTFWI